MLKLANKRASLKLILVHMDHVPALISLEISDCRTCTEFSAFEGMSKYPSLAAGTGNWLDQACSRDSRSVQLSIFNRQNPGDWKALEEGLRGDPLLYNGHRQRQLARVSKLGPMYATSSLYHNTPLHCSPCMIRTGLRPLLEGSLMLSAPSLYQKNNNNNNNNKNIRITIIVVSHHRSNCH